jgi:hypothetical protein
MRDLLTLNGLMGAAALGVFVLSVPMITPAYADGVDVSDTLTVFFPGPPLGSGGVDTTLSVDESQPQGSSNLYFLGPAFPASTLPLPGPTILFEPDGTISDIVGVCEGCGQNFFAVGFLSDTNGPLSPTDVSRFLNSEQPTFMLETGNPVDATLYLAPGLVGLGYTAQFTSDVEAVGVPGPIAGAGLPGLLFAGGGLLAWWRRKRTPSGALAA